MNTMLNLKQLVERYPKGLGEIRFGSHNYYEIDSDKPLSLNSYGGSKGFVLSKKNEVELFEIIEAPYQFFLGEKEITDEEYYRLCDSVNNNIDEEEKLGLRLEHNNVRKWWGKTLENYYPHPYYPEKEVVGFEVISILPYFPKGFYEVEFDFIKSGVDDTLAYYTSQCLEYPEFFKPIYNE